MRLRQFKLASVLVVPILLSACSEGGRKTDHSDCVASGYSALNLLFQKTVTTSLVRWVQACMEKKGYKRIYDAGRCQKLEASVEEPRCYVKS